MFFHRPGIRVASGDGPWPFLPAAGGPWAREARRSRAVRSPGSAFESASSVVPCESGGCRHFAAPGGNIDFDLQASGQLNTIFGITAPAYLRDLVFTTSADPFPDDFPDVHVQVAIGTSFATHT